jgi:hypothetical protein
MSTESAVPNTESLMDLDGLLVTNPFGSSDYITEQMHVAFKRRLGKIASQLPVAARLVDVLERIDAYGRYRVLGDMVVRCAVQHALKQVETGQPYGLPLDMCNAVLSTTAHQVEQGVYGPLGSELPARLGPASHHAWIWSADRPDDVFAQAFRYLVVDNYSEQPCTLSSEETTMLTKGAQLVSELLPLSSRSALSHAHLVAVFPSTGVWGARSSSSEYRLSGTVFLSQRLLSNVWWVAEHLYHEALHQQLYDLRQGHTLLAPEFDRDDAPTICSLWNMPDATHGNYWDVHRSLAAFHVYVHLALLAKLAEYRAQEFEELYGPVKLTSSRTALARAQYLGEQMRESFWQELGPAGKRIVEWFSSVLDALDPSPPPQGAYVHLVLDRYSREAKEIAFLASQPDRADLAGDLLTLTREEVESARRVLMTIRAKDELARFNVALASVFDEDDETFRSDQAPGIQFARLRTLIRRTLMNVSPDGYTLSASKVPDEIVRQMVEDSSESLMTLVGR